MNGLTKGIYFYTHVRDTLVRSKDFKTFLFSIPTYHEGRFPYAHVIVPAPLTSHIYELVPASESSRVAYHEITEVSKLNLSHTYTECPSDTTQNPLLESIACSRR